MCIKIYKFEKIIECQKREENELWYYVQWFSTSDHNIPLRAI